MYAIRGYYASHRSFGTALAAATVGRSEAMEARPPQRLYLGIAAAAGAVLALEIGLTRLFSYTIWYHFAYLTISVALSYNFV